MTAVPSNEFTASQPDPGGAERPSGGPSLLPVSPARAREILIGLRLGVGVGALLAPRLLGRVFGIDPAANPASPYLARLFGIRDVMLAYQLYQAPESELEDVLRQGIVVDTSDVLAALAAGARGGIGARTLVLGGGAAAAAVCLGLAGREPGAGGSDG